MALYVEDVLRGCPQDTSSGTGKIRGQTFDSDNYNIIVSRLYFIRRYEPFDQATKLLKRKRKLIR